MKINITHTDKLTAAIDHAQEGCIVRMLHAVDIVDWVYAAEKLLIDLRIAKKYWGDCCILVSPEKVANSYRGEAYGTGAIIRRFPSGWFMTACSRTQCGKKAYGSWGPEVRLELSSTARQNLPNNYPIT